MQPVRLPFVFYDIKSKRISHRHSCNVYIRSLCGSCPADVATAARPQMLRTTTVDVIVIFNRGRRVVSWTMYGYGISSRSTAR